MPSEQQTDRVMMTTRPIIPPYAQQGIMQTDNPRLYCRPFHINDLPYLHELRTQIEVMQWTSTGAIDADLTATRTWMNRFMDMDLTYDLATTQSKPSQPPTSPQKFNFVLVYNESPDPECPIDTTTTTTSRSTHKVIGAGGCHNTTPEPECGYMIRQEFWNRGLATSFLRSFLAAWWNLDRETVHLPLTDALYDTLTRKRGMAATDEKAVQVKEYLYALIAGGNVGSRRVLEKCGFERVWEEEVEERGERVVLVDYVLGGPDRS